MSSRHFGNFYIVNNVRKELHTQDWFKTLEDVAEDDLIVFSKIYEISHNFKTLNNIYRVYSTHKEICFRKTFLNDIFKNVPILKDFFPGKLVLKVWLIVIAIDDKVTITRDTYVSYGDLITVPKNSKNLFFTSSNKNKFIILRE